MGWRELPQIFSRAKPEVAPPAPPKAEINGTHAVSAKLISGVPLPPDGILFMNKEADQGVSQGTRHARKLAERGLNMRTGLILDIGCGWGRLAYGLLCSGFEGRYVGGDIVKSRIDWLNANFASVHPRYTFKFSDVKHELYNPEGKLTRIAVGALVGDSRPTSIVLLSVFTHMYADDIAACLKDISAIMSPKSSLMFSCFLFDGIARQGIEGGTAHRMFRHELSPECRYDRPGSPLGAIAYTEPAILGLLEAAGLSGAIERGGWSGAVVSPQWGQDVVIARKKADMPTA